MGRLGSGADGGSSDDVRVLIRETLSKLRTNNPENGTSANPLLEFGSRSAKVVVLVNHVTHRRRCESKSGFAAKVTSSKVVRELVELVVENIGPEGHILVGNAPLQSCDHDLILRQTGLVQELDKVNVFGNLRIADFRGVITKWSRLGLLQGKVERSSVEGVEVDLGKHSLLEELYSEGRSPEFRVSDYSREQTKKFHAPGKHIYVLSREVLEADMIISVPKLKTHEKVGMTGVIKGCVGAIFLKQCLAHHRLGGASQGGDEFAPDGTLKRVISKASDRASLSLESENSRIRSAITKWAYRFSHYMPGSSMRGAWQGNDTAWRMSLDIARILRYGKSDGTLAETPQRKHVGVIDGIIAGEGNGPLRPRARHENVIIMGSDPLATDVMACLAMGWNPLRLPTLARALSAREYPIVDYESLGDIELLKDGKSFNLETIVPWVERPFKPPRGWSRNRLTWRGSPTQ